MTIQEQPWMGPREYHVYDRRRDRCEILASNVSMYTASRVKWTEVLNSPSGRAKREAITQIQIVGPNWI